jgi:hypothetical protein
MKRWSATLLVVGVCSAVVHADLTIVQKMTIEGGPAAAMGGGAPSPTTTSRIKGTKGRVDMDMGSANIPTNMSTITDAATKQVTVLDHNQKTARVSTGVPVQPAGAPTPDVKINASVKPTGKSQTIDGMACDEYTFTTSVDMASLGGGQMPPEASAALQGMTMVMKGSLWATKSAPGASEYLAYQKAMASADLLGAAMGSTGMSMPGMDKLAKAMGSVDGLPVLTEMSMNIEGGSGPQADMMRQMMGGMKVTQKVTSIKTDAIADDAFTVPQGYQVIK